MIYDLAGDFRTLYQAIGTIARQVMPEQAEDLAQDVALKIWTNKRCLPRQFRTAYLRKIVLNSAADIFRKARRGKFLNSSLVVNDDGSICGTGDTRKLYLVAESENYYLENCERIERVLEAIGQLNPDQREVILLTAIGFKTPEIARKQGVSLTTVKTRLHYARKYLRNKK